MRLKGIVTVSLLAIFFACKQAPPVEYQIIPHPQSITYGNGMIQFDEGIKLFFSPELEKEATFLTDCLTSEEGIKVQSADNEKDADIFLLIDPIVKSEKPEGYQLEVVKKKISIRSDCKQGIFNGVQSLRQIIQKSENGFQVQRGTITDYPAFAWRSFMLDEGRYFKGKEVVKQLLDQMAFLKMNVFQWHLTEDQGWRIEIKKYPLLTEIGSVRDSSSASFDNVKFDGVPHSGFYTHDDIREIVAYAADRHILVVPEIEMPGHSSAAIAAYPWLGTSGKQIKVPCKFGVQYDIFNVADPKVLTFFSDVFDEVIRLFPSPVVHIGGDEPRFEQWNASPQIKAYMKANGLNTPAELLVFFTNNISEMLKEKGKRMMGWNDITGDKLHDYMSDDDTKAVAQKLAEGTIVQFWKGDSALIHKTIQQGYEIVNSHHQFTYLDYSYQSIPLSGAYAFNPIPAGVSPEMQSKVLGMSCQMWGELIPTVERMNYQVYPRLAAYAECGWTKNDQKNYDRFLKALPALLDYWKSDGIISGPVTTN